MSDQTVDSAAPAAPIPEDGSAPAEAPVETTGNVAPGDPAGTEIPTETGDASPTADQISDAPATTSTPANDVETSSPSSEESLTGDGVPIETADAETINASSPSDASDAEVASTGTPGSDSVAPEPEPSAEMPETLPPGSQDPPAAPTAVAVSDDPARATAAEVASPRYIESWNKHAASKPEELPLGDPRRLNLDPDGKPIVPHSRIVLSPGQEIIIETSKGPITVRALETDDSSEPAAP